MLTARYLIDIVSGAIDDLYSMIEAESVLLESLIYNNYLVSSDDIAIVKRVNPELIFSGTLVRFVPEDKVFSQTWNKVTDRCFLWSTSLDSLEKSRNKSDYVIVSESFGLDLFKVSGQVLNKTKITRDEASDKYKEFQRLKRDSKRLGLVIAPIGSNASIERFSDLRV